jgi:hypothetical protein
MASAGTFSPCRSSAYRNHYVPPSDPHNPPFILGDVVESGPENWEMPLGTS